jgi:hypothetical protein
LNRREQAQAIEDAGSQTLYEIDRGLAFPKVRFSISTYRGREYLDVRQWVEIDGELRPTRKGISLPRDFLPELLEGVEALRRALEVPA